MNVSLLSLLFPACCVGCQYPGRYVCKQCYLRLEWLSPYRLHELESNSLAYIAAPLRLAGLNRKILHSLKYDGYRELGKTLGDLLYDSLLLPPTDVIVPVPLHWRKHWQRGYNQAEVIANQLGKQWQKPVLPLLVRIKHQQAQAAVTSKIDRQQRLASTFALNPQYLQLCLAKARILLVDDVITTGATLTACAEVLRAHQAYSIAAVGIAHGT